jgi:hypothetical protein
VGGDFPQTIAGFALAALPGLFVLEILGFGRPRLTERNGIRALGSYLAVSLIVWAVAFLFLGGRAHLASVVDSSDREGLLQVDAYAALAWRLLVASVALGIVGRLARSGIGRAALALEDRSSGRKHSRWRKVSEFATGVASMSFAWDRLLERLRRSEAPQIVHVRFLDGTELYGVLASGGSADYAADGRGMVLDAELLETDGQLTLVPGSNGVFIAPGAVASVAFVEYGDPTGDRD